MTNENTLLGIPINYDSKETILEKILKHLKNPKVFFNIVSLNPEIMVEASRIPEFKKVIEQAQIRINDGVGVVVASSLKGIPRVIRFTGVELTKELLKIADKRRLRVMLLGGMPKVAEKMVDCQKQAGSEAIFTATHGFRNIQSPTTPEINKIISIVTSFKPHIVLMALGSPFSELWLYRHRDVFKGVVCASVGGSFDYFSGTISKPPHIIRSYGLEWLYRLIRQPWRWRRQLKLITFARLVILEAVRFRLNIK